MCFSRFVCKFSRPILVFEGVYENMIITRWKYVTLYSQSNFVLISHFGTPFQQLIVHHCVVIRSRQYLNIPFTSAQFSISTSRWSCLWNNVHEADCKLESRYSYESSTQQSCNQWCLSAVWNGNTCGISVPLGCAETKGNSCAEAWWIWRKRTAFKHRNSGRRCIACSLHNNQGTEDEVSNFPPVDI